MNKKIVVLTGSFNPITKAHRMILENAINKIDADLYICINGDEPLIDNNSSMSNSLKFSIKLFIYFSNKCTVCYFDRLPINFDKIPMKQIFNWENFKEDIFCLLAPVIWNRLFLKDFLINNDLRFPNLPIYEDIGFVHCTTASATKMIAFNKELINYRFNRPKSLVSTRSKHTIEAVKSCLYLKEFLKTKKIYNELETAYENAMINHIRAEISYCNNDEYNKFLEEFKQLLPNDWTKYSQALRKDYITPEYLKNFIGDQKVMLWGASLFIKQVLEKETEKNPNILGIIDKNRFFEGEFIGNYKIFTPEAINELKPDGVILTVLSNNEIIYETLRKEFYEKNQDIELLPNIFEEELEFCKI